MRINKLLNVFICAVFCAAVMAGCNGTPEVSPTDSGYESESSDISSSDASSSETTQTVSSSQSESEMSKSESEAELSEAESSSSAHEHKYTVTKTAEPSCTGVGYELYVCSCGDQYAEQTSEALGHSYTKSTTAPDCTKSGYTLYDCTRCGESHMDDFTDALGHDLGSTTVKPTCTQGGYTLHSCSRCGYEYSPADERTAALGHDWGEWLTVKNATASSDGEKRRECSRCGETQSELIPASADIDSYAAEVINLVNSERAKNGLAPLTARNDLNEYARLRSSEITDNFAHERPDGSSPLNYVMSLNGVHTSGENIAYGQSSPEAVMNAWMNSPGHRANILNSAFTSIGVGCYEKNGRLYWTQIFAG